MSITRDHQLECGCGATLNVVVCESLNAERHPHLRDQLLARELHVFRCGACDEEIYLEKQMTYIDLPRQQFYAVAPDSERNRERELGEELAAAWKLALGDGAPRSVQSMFGASEFHVRMCFSHEELREKIIANDAGLDDLALEIFKGELMAANPEWANALVRTLRLDHVEPDGRLAFLLERYTEPISILDIGFIADRARYDQLAGEKTDKLLADWPKIASGPHVSLLRLVEHDPAAMAQ